MRTTAGGLALAVALGLACGSRAKDAAAPSPAPAPQKSAAASPAPKGPLTPRAERPAERPPSVADEAELVEEAPEANPRSEMVTIKLVADAARKARVFWGRRDLGLAPLELQRPRGSGPLDLVVLAPGALPLHTRVFTDRDDKLALRLVAESDAPTVLGYREEAPPPPAVKPNAKQNATPRSKAPALGVPP